MKEIKQLAKQTAVYGLSTTIGRFLNYLLIFLHTSVFKPEELGVVTNLYAYFAFLIVILTYGTETGYFRYVEREKDKDKIYSTLFTSLFCTSSLFVLITIFFALPIAKAINYDYNKEFIVWFGLIIGLDTFCSIPLARLRYENRAIDFAKINIICIIVNILLNLYFLLLAPYLSIKLSGSALGIVFNSKPDIKYVFIANLIASIVKIGLLSFFIKPKKFVFDFSLLKMVLKYSYPILIIGIAGMINQNADKILMPFLIEEADEPIKQLGIYGANFKLSVIMIVFIQMFRYAAEPFFFSKEKQYNAKEIYAQVMKYFILFSLFIIVGIVMYLDVLKYLIGDMYFSGSHVVPYILFGNMFLGIFYNLSIWYKLNNITLYGALIALIGSSISITLNVVLVPRIGYIGAAYAIFSSYFAMMIISFIWGRKYYKVNYPLKSILGYFMFALVFIICSRRIVIDNIAAKYICKTFLFFIFTAGIIIKERKFIKELRKG